MVDEIYPGVWRIMKFVQTKHFGLDLSLHGSLFQDWKRLPLASIYIPRSPSRGENVEKKCAR